MRRLVLACTRLSSARPMSFSQKGMICMSPTAPEWETA